VLQTVLVVGLRIPDERPSEARPTSLQSNPACRRYGTQQ